MRRIAPPLLLAIAACGGGAEPTQPAPPPPPPGTTGGAPASLTIQAGDNQQADAGTPVPVRPAVLVKDASGRAVAGVRVTFAVDSGGGQVGGADATTGSNGVATSGDWTLGPLDGPNTLHATVSGLPVLTFRAQGKPAPRTLADTTLQGGGTIAVVRQGDPANGVRIVVPNGSLPAGTRVTIRALPPPAITLPEGVTQVGPVLELAGFPASYSDSMLTLRIPVAIPDAQAAAAFIRDPSTGRLELLSPISQDSGSITLATRHFSAALMMPGAAASLVQLPRAVSAAQVIQVIVTQALKSKLAQGVDSHFRPGTDDWEFPNYGSVIAPDGHCAGQSISAMYYYLRWKPIKGPLFGRFDDGKNALSDNWYDNPRGYRFASVVQEVSEWSKLTPYFFGMKAAALAAGTTTDDLHYHALALAMLVTGEPQFLAIYRKNPDQGHAIIAWRVEAGQVLVADPNFPGETHAIGFASRRFQPYASKANAAAAGTTYNEITTFGTTLVIPTASLDAQWAKVENRTIGDDKFPADRIEYWDYDAGTWNLMGDTLRTRQDTVRVRATCSSCPYWFSGSNKEQWIKAYYGPIGSTAGGEGGVDFEAIGGASQIDIFTQSWSNATDNAWLNYRIRTVISNRFYLTPDTAKSAPDSVVRFTAHPGGEYPAAARYVWNFGDGTAPVTVALDSVVDHAYTKEGTFTVTVELRDGPSGSKVARATTHARINGPKTRWRLTSLLGVAPPWGGSGGATATRYAEYGAFFGAIQAQPSLGLLEYLENDPQQADMPSVTLSLDPPGSGAVNAAVLARSWEAGSNANSACTLSESVLWTGGISSGTVGGSSVGQCIRDNGDPPHTLEVVKFTLAASKLGQAIGGTITVTYQDFTKDTQIVMVNGHPVQRQIVVPTEKYTVSYAFTGVREAP